MNDFQFNELVDSNIITLIPIIVFVVSLYWVIVRRSCFGLLDPLGLGFLASSMATVVTCFLFSLKIIEFEVFFKYISIEGSFILGFLTYVKAQKINKNVDVVFHVDYIKNRYIVYFSYFIIQLLVYSLIGLPILNAESRLEAFRDMKILGWLVDGAQFNAIACVVIALNYKNRSYKFLDYLMFLFCLFALLVKGGKSDFILLFSMFFLAAKILGNVKLSKYLLWSIPVLASALLLVTQIIISVWGLEVSAAELVSRRLLAFGDIYYMGLTPDIKKYFDDGKIFFRLFPSVTDQLSDLGLVSHQWTGQTPIGYALYEHYYGVDRGAGPNPRMTYVLMMGLSYGGVVVSFFYGVFIAWVRFGLFKFCRSLYATHYFLTMNLCLFFAFIDPALFIVYSVKSTVFFGGVVSVLKAFSWKYKYAN